MEKSEGESREEGRVTRRSDKKVRGDKKGGKGAREAIFLSVLVWTLIGDSQRNQIFESDRQEFKQVNVDTLKSECKEKKLTHYKTGRG